MIHFILVYNKGVYMQNLLTASTGRQKKFRCPVDMTEKNNSRTIIFTQVKNLSTVLDVGCASGELGITLNKMKSCKVYGIDNCIRHITTARKSGAYEEVFNINLDENYGKMLNDYEDFFDCIILGDTLQHLKNPQLALCKLKKLLKDDGYFLISVSNFAHASIKADLLNNEFRFSCENEFINMQPIKFFTCKNLPSFLADINIRIENLKFTYKNLAGIKNTKAYLNLPNTIINYIFSNPHSFVKQYIIKAQKSDLTQNNILEINKEIFELGTKDIKKSYLYKETYNEAKNKINLIKRHNFLILLNSCIMRKRRIS